MKVPFNGQSVAVRNILSILLILIFHSTSIGQFAEFNTGPYEDVWRDAVVDSDGNVYTVGTYTNSTFVDGNSLDNLISPSYNKTQLMVAKYNSSGILIWLTYGQSPCASNNKGWTTGTRIAIGEATGRVFIAGEHAGMQLNTSAGIVPIDNLLSDPLNPGTACLGNDNNSEPYIISLDMYTGNYYSYTKNLRGIVTSMVVADDGPFNNHLYTSLHVINDKNALIYRVNPFTLNPSGGNHVISTTVTGVDHIINDIKYDKENIYCIGTTEGSIQFDGLSMNIPLPIGGITAWAAVVKNPNGSIGVSAINHGGIGSSRMTGDQIYADEQGNIVIAGRFADALVNPFSSNQTYTSLASNTLKNAYLMRLNKNSLITNDAIHTVETTMSQYNVQNIWLAGINNEVFLSMTYTGNLLYFVPFTGSYIDLYPFNSYVGKKIAVASYSITPVLTKLWHNTTYGMSPDDIHCAEGNAIYQDLVYTVGNFKERIYFDYIPSLTANISFSTPDKKALIIRNDSDWNVADGGFKSNKEDGENKINDLDFSIYPNPNNGSFYVDNVSKEDKIEVFDMLGKSLSFTLSFSEDKAYIEIENSTSVVLLKINDIGYQVMINE